MLHHYVGPEYPQLDEIDDCIQFIKNVVESCRCVSPVNDQRTLKNFTELKIDAEQVKPMLIEIAQKANKDTRSLFRSDLPLQLINFFEKDIIGKIFYAKAFQNDE